jgi:hypothetical protein
MTWEWSYSPETKERIHELLAKKPREFLIEAFGEWGELDGKGETENAPYILNFNDELYTEKVLLAETLPTETLVNYIYERMKKQSTCENGGHKVHACPFGCHLVEVSTEENDNE